jgi:branched-chain amino acid transport system substrate-binding protein
MNKKKIVGGIIIILIVLITIAFGLKPKDTSAIRLGFVAPLSGDGASYGETEKNATDIAVSEINSAGGINGRKIEIIYEDGKCTGKDATTAIQKLINVDKVNIILGGTCSSETLAIAPIAEKNKILLFSAFSSSPFITNSGDYIFRNAPSDDYVAKFDANTISTKYTNVAIISENTDYSQSARKIMEDIFSQKGTKVVADEIYNSGTKDFRTILTKIKSINPEVIFLNPASDTRAGGIMVKQARELGVKTPIHGNVNVVTEDSISIGGKYMNGVISTDGTGLAQKGLDLLTKYKNTYKVPPTVEYEMGSAYDRVYIIKQAIEKVGTNTAKIKDYLYGIQDFTGAIGTYHFDQNGDVVGIGAINVVIQDGKKVPYKQ